MRDRLWHDLRHTFASRLTMAGVSARIRELLEADPAVSAAAADRSIPEPQAPCPRASSMRPDTARHEFTFLRGDSRSQADVVQR
jgi:hypothetical protein